MVGEHDSFTKQIGDDFFLIFKKKNNYIFFKHFSGFFTIWFFAIFRCYKIVTRALFILNLVTKKITSTTLIQQIC